MKHVHQSFTLGDHNEIVVDDLIRVADIVDEDPNLPFEDWINKLSSNKKGFTFEEMSRIMNTPDEGEEDEE